MRTPPRAWSIAEIKRLRKMAADGRSAREIAERLGRTVRTVRGAATQRGIVIRTIRQRTIWTQEMDDHLRAQYPHTLTASLAEQYGLRSTAIYARAQKLGLRKSPELLGSPRSGRGHINDAGRFRPGHATWNAGTKGLTGTHPNCRAHHFKPGNMSGQANYNYLPIGSTRIADGQLQRKVRDDGPTPRRWIAVARLVWEAANGRPVPRGHVIRFRDGQATTEERHITIERLECITQQENMRRNSVHTVLPPDAAHAAQLRGALNRRIRNLEKKLNEHHR